MYTLHDPHVEVKKNSLLATGTGYLRKKYGVVDYQYFKNGTTQQRNIFRHKKYIFHLVVCEVSTPQVKCKLSYKCKNGGSNGTWNQLANSNTRIFYHPNPI